MGKKKKKENKTIFYTIDIFSPSKRIDSINNLITIIIKLLSFLLLLLLFI